MREPLISIILPVFNGEKYLAKAIDSCLEQSYKNIELIIVEDHSKDFSLEIAKKYVQKDSRIRLICNDQNRKLPASLNIGHNEAKGEFLTWTSHDNYYHPDAIRAMYECLISEEVDVVYTNYLTIDENDKLINCTILKEIEYSFFYGVVGACFLYTKDFHLKNGEYDEDLFLLEDFDYWLRGLKHSKFYKLNNPGFYCYRYHEEALTSKINNNLSLKIEFQQKLVKCYEKLFDIESSNHLKSELLDFFSCFQRGDVKTLMIPFCNNLFFKDLKNRALVFKGISYRKLKRIIVNNCIDVILKNRQYQKISILLYLHFYAGHELLRLPVERYLALCKKCLF